MLSASEIKVVTLIPSGNPGAFAFARTEQVDLIEGPHFWLACTAEAR